MKIGIPDQTRTGIKSLEYSRFVQLAYENKTNISQSPENVNTQKSQNLTLGPTKATTPEEVMVEVSKLDVSNINLSAGQKNFGTYIKPVIGKAELKTIFANSPEFKANSVLTVIENKDGELRLAFNGNKIHFEINPDAMGLKTENLKAGDKIRVDEQLLTGKEQQMPRQEKAQSAS